MAAAVTIGRERPDQPEVVAALAALDAYLASLYPPDANHILSVAELLAPEVGFFVARDGGVVVGTGAVRCCVADGGGEPYGEVKRMYVAPQARGRRIGRRLLEVLEGHLLGEGLALARLETGADQTEAVRLYERSGYRRRGAFGGYPDNGLSLFYEKRL